MNDDSISVWFCLWVGREERILNGKKNDIVYYVCTKHLCVYKKTDRVCKIYIYLYTIYLYIYCIIIFISLYDGGSPLWLPLLHSSYNMRFLCPCRIVHPRQDRLPFVSLCSKKNSLALFTTYSNIRSVGLRFRDIYPIAVLDSSERISGMKGSSTLRRRWREIPSVLMLG